MRALVSRSYGPLEDLVITDHSKPSPGPNEVLVRVQGAALNAVDVALVTGAMRDTLPIAHPLVPGVDVSGVDDDVGDGLRRFSVDDSILVLERCPVWRPC